MIIGNEILSKLYNVCLDSYNSDEIPVAAAIFDSKNNELIAISGNNRQGTNSVLGHAEINCILEAERKIKDWRLDGYYMIVSLEPCDMCSMVIRESRLDKIYYILPKKQLSTNEIEICKEQVDIDENDKEKFTKLLTIFFDNKR